MNKIKLILVGEGAVGKTSIISQFKDKQFKEEYLMTVGNDKVIKELVIENEKIILEIWDTPGQNEYNAVNKIFMKNSKISIIVYSIIDTNSFKKLDIWLENVKKVNKNHEMIIGIAANKSDLFEKAQISKEEGENYAKDKDILFFETSAKDYKSIEKLFITLTKLYLEKNKKKKNSTSIQQMDDKKSIELMNNEKINHKKKEDLKSNEEKKNENEAIISEISLNEDDSSSKCSII